MDGKDEDVGGGDGSRKWDKEVLFVFIEPKTVGGAEDDDMTFAYLACCDEIST